MSNIATFTPWLYRSPRMRIRGPVMLTTEGFSASELVLRITSISPMAADSFTSAEPFRIPSRNIGRIGIMPCTQLHHERDKYTHSYRMTLKDTGRKYTHSYRMTQKDRGRKYTDVTMSRDVKTTNLLRQTESRQLDGVVLEIRHSKPQRLTDVTDVTSHTARLYLLHTQTHNCIKHRTTVLDNQCKQHRTIVQGQLYTDSS